MRKSRPNAVQFSGTLVSKSKRNMDQRRFSSSRIIESRQVIVGPALVKVELRKVDGEPEIFTVTAMVLSVSQEQPQASSSNPIASEVCTPNLAGIRKKETNQACEALGRAKGKQLESAPQKRRGPGRPPKYQKGIIMNCPYCPRTSSPTLMNRHMRIHRGPFECQYDNCGARYSNQTSLTKHQIEMHGLKVKRPQDRDSLARRRKKERQKRKEPFTSASNQAVQVKQENEEQEL